MKDIVVVGGGFAGWLTALYANKSFPKSNVIVIESQSIGILGAGEGSVPYLVGLLQFLDIPLTDLIINCKSTIKNGIKFDGWSEKNKEYFHAFDPGNRNHSICHYAFQGKEFESPKSFPLYLESFMKKRSTDDFNYMAKLSAKNKVPFIKNNDNSNNSIMNFVETSYWSIHFDAALIAKYMKDIALSRNIQLIDGIVSSFTHKENGDIENICLQDGSVIHSDFIFDCSGLHRLIIGKHFNSEWDSYGNYLPVKKAIPFFIKEEPAPYTSAIAMDYGWMWKIPLQHRTGAGYVFDSDFINEDRAKEELDKFIGYEVESPRTIPFNPGSYKEIWINNVIAIGLSGGFIEPLEASSIWMFARNLERFFSDKTNISNPQINRDRFNAQAKKEADQIRDFIYLHYLTDKTNNDFWKFFAKNNETPDSIKEVLEIIKFRPPYESEINDRMYWDSYYQIIFGNNIFNHEGFFNFYINNYNHGRVSKGYDELVQRQNNSVLTCVSMKDFINSL